MNTDNFYLNYEEPLKSCFLAMQNLLLQLDSSVQETVKYGMPCFTYLGKAFAYLWFDKKTNEPYLLIVEGHLIHHPHLETGSRKRMKILRVNSLQDLPIDTINTVLQFRI